MPNFFTTKKMRTLLKVVPKMHSKVPSTAPKAYPAPISRGSPGTMAIITWKATMPKKASRPQKPWLSTQARNCSGWETNCSMGLPTNQHTARENATNNPRHTSATARFFLCSRFSIKALLLVRFLAHFNIILVYGILLKKS